MNTKTLTAQPTLGPSEGLISSSVLAFCRFGIVKALAALGLLTATSPVQAQCNSTSSAADQSTNGSVRMQAVSTQINCTDRVMYVKGWIENLSFACITGTAQSGYCIANKPDGNASVTLGAQACGPWTGQSRHWYFQGTTLVDLPNRSPALWGGVCNPCAALGPDYIWNGSTCVYTKGTPIIIATGRSADYRLTSAAEGVAFDIDGDGVPEQVAWTTADSEVAFLALDRDHDGYITSGKELFGSHTLPGSPNGFDALMNMAMETNGGVRRSSVSSDDPIFEKLLLWTDRNHNGISEPSELRPAREVLSDIGLGYTIHTRRDQFGNLFLFQGWATFRTAPGRNRAEDPAEQDRRRRLIYDVAFDIAP
jgi:hypothetical protein